jgi:superfamily II DNA or RNA helicase
MYKPTPFYPHQEEDYKNIQKAFSIYKSVVYRAPTGSGKSVIISRFIIDKILEGKKILFMSNRTHLQNQMNERLQGNGVKDLGIFSSSNKKALNNQVILVTIQTAIANNNMELLLDTHIDFIVIDECHRSITKSYLDIIRGLTMKNNDICLFGVTATTNRFDMKPLNTVFESIVHCSKTMSSLVEDGYLAKYRVFTIPMMDLEEQIESFGGDYAMESMSKYMTNPVIVKKCIEQYEKYAKGRSTIIYCVDKKHTVQLKEAYAKAGYSKSVIIDESVSEKLREEYFEKFRTKEIDIIFCIETLTEGLDLPNCNCIQLCRPTKSMILYLQMVGRGLRVKEDGGDCIILDSSLNVDRLGMPTSDIEWDLEGKRHKRKDKKGKVVVYKGEDGKIFFSHDEDVPYAEMVEANFGELAQANQDLIEFLEKQNDRIYMEFYAQFKELCLYIIQGAGIDINKITFIEETQQSIINYEGERRVAFYIKDMNYGLSMEINHRNRDLILVEKMGSYSIDRAEKLSECIQSNNLNRMFGNICGFINDNMKNVLSNLAKIRTDLENINDIDELRELQKNIDEENFNNHIESELNKHGKVFFRLDKKFSMDEYAPNLGYSSFECYLMLSNQTKLLTNNKVVFYKRIGEDSLKVEYSTKYMKQDRLKEIIKRFNGDFVNDMSNITDIEEHDFSL